jgi:hypothetical protein
MTDTQRFAKAYFARFALLLAIAVPSPCRFSSGIVLMLFFNCCVFFGVALNRFVLRVRLGNFLAPFSIYGTVFFAVFFRQLLAVFSPSVALSTGFSLYVAAFCAWTAGRYGRPLTVPFVAAAAGGLKDSLKFSALALALFFVREVLGAGTISFPAPESLFAGGIIEIRLPRVALFRSFVFFASVPGAVVLSVAAMTGLIAFGKKRGGDV